MNELCLYSHNFTSLKQTKSQNLKNLKSVNLSSICMNINYCKQFHYLTPGYHHAEILSELALGMEQAWPLGSVSPRNGRNNNSMLNFNSNTVNNEVTKQN